MVPSSALASLLLREQLRRGVRDRLLLLLREQLRLDWLLLLLPLLRPLAMSAQHPLSRLVTRAEMALVIGGGGWWVVAGGEWWVVGGFRLCLNLFQFVNRICINMLSKFKKTENIKKNDCFGA